MRVAPFGDVTVLKPLRWPVPLPASGVPGRASHLVFPIVTSARRNALRITRWHGAGDVPRPPPRSLAPDIRVTAAQNIGTINTPRPTTATTRRQDDPRRGAKKLLLRCPDSWRWGHVAHLLAASPTPRTAPMPEAAAESCRSLCHDNRGSAPSARASGRPVSLSVMGSGSQALAPAVEALGGRCTAARMRSVTPTDTCCSRRPTIPRAAGLLARVASTRASTSVSATKLLTVEEALEAFSRGGGLQYRAPCAAGLARLLARSAR
jgi:hypothetical protein